MRTRLMRGKFLLLFMTFGILLAIPAIAFAQDVTGSTSPAPTIQSDKADYAPGELVTLTGGGWQPGESVSIFVDDADNHSWQRTVTVTAYEDGSIFDEFNLPESWVATYSVEATGESSGNATTTFTDSLSPAGIFVNGQFGGVTVEGGGIVPGTLIARAAALSLTRRGGPPAIRSGRRQLA